MEIEKINLETIIGAIKEIQKYTPEPKHELRCGSLFDCELSKMINSMGSFNSAIVNNPLFKTNVFYGMEVVLDETLPPNMARIGDQFIRLIV